MTLPRLIFVTGKGGTGKSTLSAALALGLARRHRALLADLDRRLSAARMLGVAEINGGGRVRAIDNLEVTAFTPRAELEAFIERLVPLKAISRRLLESRTFGHVTAALPGLEAFLMLERLRMLAGQCALEDSFAVIDAPATGNAVELLSVAAGVKQLAAAGTLNRLAAGVEEFLKDASRFGVILTVTAEDLALREALQTAAILRESLGIRCIAAALNGVATSLFTPAEIEKIDALGAHARLARQRHAAVEFATHARNELTRAGLNVVELPMLFKPILGRRELEQLASKFVTELAPQ
jgi:Mrp family chromosome partitioning ATPase